MQHDEFSEKIETQDNTESCKLPMYGVYCADWESVPFGDLYLDMFPEQYDVE